MTKFVFIGGLIAGVAIAKNWRALAKEGIKASVWARRKFTEISTQVMEDIEDVTAEVQEELAREEQEGQAAPHQKEVNGQ